jgi:transcriptional regulator with XRE-family HTH domain
MVVNNAQIGQKIKTFRRRRGLSQFALAELVDKSPAFISYIERGKKSMSIETFVYIANALNVSADELLVDNLENTVRASNHIFADLLSDCSEFERRVLKDILVASKTSLRSNVDYLSLRR